MSADEFAYTAFALTSFAVLRVGVPVLAMILLSRLCCRTFHLPTA